MFFICIVGEVFYKLAPYFSTNIGMGRLLEMLLDRHYYREPQLPSRRRDIFSFAHDVRLPSLPPLGKYYFREPHHIITRRDHIFFYSLYEALPPLLPFSPSILF